MSYYSFHENCQISLSFIYEQYFGLRDNGYFVDIGAYNGIDFSNVWGLVQKGWSGIALEPNPETYEILKKNYQPYAPKVRCVRWGAGKMGKARLSLSQTLSTASTEQYQEFVKHGWARGNEKFVEINLKPVDYILGTFNVPGNFDVLSLDVEGAELEVLETFTIGKWLPKICLVESQEHHRIHSFGRNASQINAYFEKAGYYKIYCDMVNSIYVRNGLEDE